MLEVRGLRKSFGALRACDGIDFEVKEGETHAVIGPNGAGKTTFISQLAGNLLPDAGVVRFNGTDITALPAPKRARLGLARSFQITSIYPEFSALDNVALAVQANSGHSFRFWRKARGDPALVEPAKKILDEVGLGERAHVLAANLAHGEHRQLEVAMALATEPRLLLLAIARALMTNPRLLILDEATEGLAPLIRAEIYRSIESLKADGLSILVIDKDVKALTRVADRHYVLEKGRVVWSGASPELASNPEIQHKYL